MNLRTTLRRCRAFAFPCQPSPVDTTFRRTKSHVTATHDISESISLVAGIEHQNEDGRLVSVGDFLFDGNPLSLESALERDTDSIFAEGQFQLTPPVIACRLACGATRLKI